MNFTIGPIEVPSVSRNQDDWKVIIDESYRPERGKFIYDAFKRDFPNIKVSSSDQVFSLCSRSSIMTEWLAGENLNYAKVEAAPTYFRDHVTPQEYEQASNQINDLNSLNETKAKKMLSAAQAYSAKIKEIEEEYNKAVNNKQVKGIDKILSLKSTDLPLTILLSIENFTPTNIAGSPSSRTYAREMLVNYKVSLLKYIKSNPNVDINDIIEKNKVK